MTDAENGNIMDIIVAQAAREAADELGGGTEPAARADAPVMTPKARRKILRMIERRPLPLHLKIMRAAACITLIAFVGLGGTVMSVEALREKFISYVYDKNAPSTEFSIKIDPKQPYNCKILRLNFVPDGFKCIESRTGYTWGDEYLHFYCNNKNFTIDMYCYDGTMSVDTEGAELENIEINDYDAVIISKTYPYEGLCHSVIWSDGKHRFFLHGNLSKEDMLKIAENVTVSEQ